MKTTECWLVTILTTRKSRRAGIATGITLVLLVPDSAVDSTASSSRHAPVANTAPRTVWLYTAFRIFQTVICNRKLPLRSGVPPITDTGDLNHVCLHSSFLFVENDSGARLQLRLSEPFALPSASDSLGDEPCRLGGWPRHCCCQRVTSRWTEDYIYLLATDMVLSA
jgi:hypothetical protein